MESQTFRKSISSRVVYKSPSLVAIRNRLAVRLRGRRGPTRAPARPDHGEGDPSFVGRFFRRRNGTAQSPTMPCHRMDTE